MSEFTVDQRADAARSARDILSYGNEYCADDIVVLADWLLTGRCDIAVRMADQRARAFSGSVEVSPDAARWTLPETSGTCGKPIVCYGEDLGTTCWLSPGHEGDCQC